VEWKSRIGLPSEQYSHLAFHIIAVEDLQPDLVKLGLLPLELIGIDIDGAALGGFELSSQALTYLRPVVLMQNQTGADTRRMTCSIRADKRTRKEHVWLRRLDLGRHICKVERRAVVARVVRVDQNRFDSAGRSALTVSSPQLRPYALPSLMTARRGFGFASATRGIAWART
jgi:hypothetical protein